ncbi:carotenoid oxygenase family protein [Kutzneria viridogrisea]|uniref:Dioxygenase n=1 Tax=Kutzneria viridogrisea TaxID=47990 RepID=A0ABR6BB65_9PSEU|nr:carotenoid cleavage dioxygenase [Kutzneria viridogrisea]
MTSTVLQGNFGPVASELTVTELPVTGHIPEQLDGRYLRNGPNPVLPPNPRTYNWFLGSGMVHGVRIRGGRAEWYRNRFVRDGFVASALGEQRPAGPRHAGTDFSANTNVLGHAGRTLALVEGGSLPYELTEELDTVGACDFGGTLRGGYTAHPKIDPRTGELHAVSYYWAAGSTVQYTVVGLDGRVRRTVDIPVGGSPMMHDFSLTENYVVLYDLPVTFDFELAAKAAPKLLRKPVEFLLSQFIGRRPVPGRIAERVNRKGGGALPYAWNPDHPARVGVLPRNGSVADLRWFEVEACYVFHALNAYEQGEELVLDVVRHPQMFATDRLTPNEGGTTLDRWTIDLSAGKLREDRFSEVHQEFPRVDERLLGSRHRYGYTIGSDGGVPGLELNSLCKHDLLTGDTRVHSFGKGHGAGEFVFVPTGAEEDAGVLMGMVYDASEDRSDLVLLDAQTLDTAARIHLPTRVPYGFHGNWMPS